MTTQVIRYTGLPSPVGPVYIASGSDGVCALNFRGNSEQRLISYLKKSFPEAEIIADRNANINAVKQLKEYFAGQRRQFDLRLAPKGTEFQRQVWSKLETIPYGETRSYAEVAAMVKRPKAYRAVGNVNHRNPIPIIVPCHRVVASNGGLGGYAGGLKLKTALLDFERSHAKR